MTKARPAPLGATYKRSVRVGQLNPEPDATPNGAKHVLFDRGYKDFAPTELARGIAKVDPWASTVSNPPLPANPSQTSVTSVPLW